MPVSTAAEAPPPAPQYQLMQGQQVQYMPAPGTVPPSGSHVYQAQVMLMFAIVATVRVAPLS